MAPTVEDSSRGSGSNTWGQRLRELVGRLGKDKIGIVAGGLAFYALLGLFPGMVALVSIAGLFLDEKQVETQLEFIGDILPGGGAELVTDQLSPLAQTGSGLLSLGIVIGLVGAIWALSSAMNNLFSAMQVAYGVENDRHFVLQRALAILFALGALGAGLVVLLALVFGPVVGSALGLGAVSSFLITWGRWPLLVAIVFASFLLVYRFGIRRRVVRWRSLMWGAAFGTGIWIAASAGFAVYVTYFADYSQLYGALSTVIILLMWFLLSAFAILLGAELNALLEREHGSRPGQPGTLEPEQDSRTWKPGTPEQESSGL
jgi:membrane protein